MVERPQNEALKESQALVLAYMAISQLDYTEQARVLGYLKARYIADRVKFENATHPIRRGGK